MDRKNVSNSTTSPVSVTQFSPVVSVLGHVDHGKTTLLDAIRKSDIAPRETGGITQKIGASSIEVMHEGKKRTITFIDTPGHEAFANMRSQGVNASDIVLLIIASDDGVMPQTKESIQKILEAKIPYIVVFTKSDAPGAILEKVKQQVLREGIVLEGLGGEVPFISVSAKTGDNIQALLDLILLVYDLSGIKKNEVNDFTGVIIEAKLDKKRGITASVIGKEGKLCIGEKVYSGEKEVGKVRALFDTSLKGTKVLIPGDAREVLGLTEVLPAGSILRKHPQKPTKIQNKQLLSHPSAFNLSEFFAKEKNDKVSIILKTETSGELEAIKSSLPDTITIVSEGQGEISVADILLAKDFHSLVLGFNVDIHREAKILADNEKVFYKSYKIIYQLLDEIAEVLESLRLEELPQGKAQILAKFSSSSGTVLGARVLDGKLSIHDKVILIRKEVEIGKAKISTLKQGKDEVKEVKKGSECGLTLSPSLDFAVGDVLLSHSK